MTRTGNGLDGFILLPKGGYCFGVEAGSRNDFVELHGGFKTYEKAEAYRVALLAEYSDYAYAKVVKIETPDAGRPEAPQFAKDFVPPHAR